MLPVEEVAFLEEETTAPAPRRELGRLGAVIAGVMLLTTMAAVSSKVWEPRPAAPLAAARVKSLNIFNGLPDPSPLPDLNLTKLPCARAVAGIVKQARLLVPSYAGVFDHEVDKGLVAFWSTGQMPAPCALDMEMPEPNHTNHTAHCGIDSRFAWRYRNMPDAATLGLRSGRNFTSINETLFGCAHITALPISEILGLAAGGADQEEVEMIAATIEELLRGDLRMLIEFSTRLLELTYAQDVDTVTEIFNRLLLGAGYPGPLATAFHTVAPRMTPWSYGKSLTRLLIHLFASQSFLGHLGSVTEIMAASWLEQQEEPCTRDVLLTECGSILSPSITEQAARVNGTSVATAKKHMSNMTSPYEDCNATSVCWLLGSGVLAQTAAWRLDIPVDRDDMLKGFAAGDSWHVGSRRLGTMVQAQAQQSPKATAHEAVMVTEAEQRRESGPSVHKARQLPKKPAPAGVLKHGSRVNNTSRRLMGSDGEACSADVSDCTAASSDGTVRLVFQKDRNLVMYWTKSGQSKVWWDSGTTGINPGGNAIFTMHNGQLMVTNGLGAIFWSLPMQGSGRKFTVTNYCTLSFCLDFACSSRKDFYFPGKGRCDFAGTGVIPKRVYTASSQPVFQSPDGKTHLKLESDGSLMVVREKLTISWAKGTSSSVLYWDPDVAPGTYYRYLSLFADSSLTTKLWSTEIYGEGPLLIGNDCALLGCETGDCTLIRKERTITTTCPLSNQWMFDGSSYSNGKKLTAASSELVIQSDGNFVLYHVQNDNVKRAIWSTSTAGYWGALLQLNRDGSMVIMSGVARFTAHAPRLAYLLLTNTCQGIGYDWYGQAQWATWWSPQCNPQTGPDAAIVQGQLYRASERWEWWSPNTNTRTAFQEDGNLVIYNSGTAAWSSGTAGLANMALTLQQDGNLVLYQMVAKYAANGGGRYSQSLSAASSNKCQLQLSDGGTVYQTIGSAACVDTSLPCWINLVEAVSSVGMILYSLLTNIKSPSLKRTLKTILRKVLTVTPAEFASKTAEIAASSTSSTVQSAFTSGGISLKNPVATFVDTDQLTKAEKQLLFVLNVMAELVGLIPIIISSIWQAIKIEVTNIWFWLELTFSVAVNVALAFVSGFAWFVLKVVSVVPDVIDMIKEIVEVVKCVQSNGGLT